MTEVKGRSTDRALDQNLPSAQSGTTHQHCQHRAWWPEGLCAAELASSLAGPPPLLHASPRRPPLFLGPLESAAYHPFPQRIVPSTKEETSWPYQISGFMQKNRLQRKFIPEIPGLGGYPEVTSVV